MLAVRFAVETVEQLIWVLSETTSIFLGAPAVPVAVNVTGDPASPVDVACTVFAPAFVLSVRTVDEVAFPLASVVTFTDD
ncbi:MAG: hypothetical protein BWY95_02632 [Bacteroidetes bacterium ADurb.BinA104]|nr:MAG: hypothetical protein BWY95_02632 [Bacteroidetes bacterium ADurb.BinA104]